MSSAMHVVSFLVRCCAVPSVLFCLHRQLMSYGKGTGAPYVSDLTLAFLEDTGHYRIANGTGGSLITDLDVQGQCGSSGNTAYIDYVFGNDQTQDVRAWMLLVVPPLLHQP